ncbi:uncharacterized protein LOC122869409 isoform X2 [Siniperca chuatsi]|uniref:uncharacterized protein LOC122869409 isoform X2 n=1 Tax=Siniperca chuatsi TaxID=119488 RepID=UPI001CE1476A|nr:uncharacterized protein LOC122869409 isoform X2 [Siniperca chuatsi]
MVVTHLVLELHFQEKKLRLLVQTDLCGPRVPAKELVDHCIPSTAAVPGVWPGHGGGWNSHGYSANVNSKSARVLAIVVVPGHLLFLYTIHLLQGGHTAMRPTFIICYLSAALLQVVILLYVASLMVRWLWRRGLDNFSIPYLTALGDLLGTSFLALSFRLILMLKPLGHLLTVSLMLSQHLCSSLPCLTSHSKTNFRGDANAMNWSFW